MPIKYIPSGNKFKASQLWGEGRHQLSILKNLMSFQNLQQDQRLVRFEDGTIIKCLSCFGQDVVNVFVPFGEVKEEIYRKEKETTCFRFKVIRDDGVIMDETMFKDPDSSSTVAGYIRIYQQLEDGSTDKKLVGLAYEYNPKDTFMAAYWTLNEDKNTWNLYYDYYPDNIVECSYNIDTQVWTIPFFEWKDRDMPVCDEEDYRYEGANPFYEFPDDELGKEFWVKFYNTGSDIVSWYAMPENDQLRYTYKTADLYKEEDLIAPELYNVAVPYFEIVSIHDDHVSYTADPQPWDDSEYRALWNPPRDCPDHEDPNCDSFYNASGGDWFQGLTTINKAITDTCVVKSSVEYKVTIAASKAYVAFYGDCTAYCCNVTEAQCRSHSEMYWWCDDAGSDQVSVATSEGDSSSNLDSNPIDSEHIIVPTPYTVQERNHTITINYTGPDPYEYDAQGIAVFEMPFKFFKSNGDIAASAFYD